MKKLALILITLVITTSLVACSTNEPIQEAANQPPIEKAVTDLELYGKVAPRESIHLTFKQGFKVTKVHVKEGDLIESQAPIADVDLSIQQSELSLLELQIKQLQQQVGGTNTAFQQANANLESAKARELQALKDYEKHSALYKAGSTTAQDLEKAKDDYENAKREVASSKIAVNGALQSGKQTNAALAVDLAKAQQQADQIRGFLESDCFKDGQLINTFDQVIVANISLQTGLYVSPQESVLEMYPALGLIVKANVSEENLSRVTVGQMVSIKPLSNTEKVYQGKVTAISYKAEQIGGETMIPVAIEIEASEDLVPGLNVDVTVHGL